MSAVTELGYAESMGLLRASDYGRVAFHPPAGLRIVPVNYTVADGAVVWRTAPYSELGTYGSGQPAVFEVDSVDSAAHRAWSVVASGRMEVVSDYDEVVLIRAAHGPKPLAGGSRNLYMKLRIDDLTGRRIGPGSEWVWQTRVHWSFSTGAGGRDDH